MFDTLIATKVRGKNDFGLRPERITREPTGWRGQRDFWINCDDPMAAANAPGLPRVNDAWSPDYPTLLCRSIDVTHHAGGSDRTTGTGGVCIASCVYETAGLRGRIDPPELGKASTLVTRSTTQVQRYYDARLEALDPGFVGPPSPDLARPIGNGRGVAVDVGQQIYEVTWYPTEAQYAGLMRKLDELSTLKAVNSDEILLPPVLHTSVRYKLAPGQARYIEYRVEEARGGVPEEGRSGLLALVQSIQAAPDFLYRWASEDEFGNAVYPLNVNQVYPTRSFAGIFG